MAGPRSNKRASEYEEDDGFVANDSDENLDLGRPKKKPRSTKSSKSATSESTGGPIKDNEGNPYWEISTQRRVTISKFKGQTFVNIREFYEKDGQDLPGKKGIALNIEQYNTFLELLPEIEKALKDQGEAVPRPDYTASANGANNRDRNDRDGVSDDAGGFEKEKKSNIEATSDEEEDD